MKIIGMSLTHNDKSKGWLENWLNTNLQYLDAWVMCDDCSDDGTFEWIMENKDATACNVHNIKTDEPTFKTNENKIRNKLWEKVRQIADPGDFILVIDSDELLTVDFERLRDVVKDKTGQFTFKKCEMWDKDNYRIDGLWSNYFLRGFKFEDKEWGFYGEGFHHPQVPKYVTQIPQIINTDMRVKHLAYSTEELRNDKYNFMMNNPQQSKDITYYHLQTIKGYAQLQRFECTPKVPTISLTLNCYNLFNVPHTTRHFLENIKYEGDIYVNILCSECHYNFIKEIEGLDVNCKEIKFNITNFQREYNEKRNKKNVLRHVSFMNTNIQDYNFFIDAEYPISEAMIKHIVKTEKSILVNRGTPSMICLDFDSLKVLQPVASEFAKYDNFNTALLNFVDQSNKFIWGVDYGTPFPVNAGRVITKIVKEDK